MNFTPALLSLAATVFSCNALAAAPNPFKDFPPVPTSAKPGELVLVPSFNWIEDGVTKGTDKVTFIYYKHKLTEAGATESKVDFGGQTKIKEVPNYMLIPLGSGVKAKKGDILLTWWQTGSGMQRAYVVDASNPEEPVVKYLDIDYDNPAKRDGVGIGQMSEKLKPASFTKIDKAGDIGTAYACKDGKDYRHALLVAASKDKVLMKEHAGKINLRDKASCQALELIPKVKAGDKVQIPWAGKFINAVVTKPDADIGRVFVEYEIVSGKKESKVISFGSVATKLEITK